MRRIRILTAVTAFSAALTASSTHAQVSLVGRSAGDLPDRRSVRPRRSPWIPG